jgi:uncharacterized protein RhaS with RHS repeats
MLIGIEGGLNTYSYVGGNPNSNSDPTGLLAPQILGALTGGLINVGIQYFTTGRINVAEVGGAALIGAATSGVSAATAAGVAARGIGMVNSRIDGDQGPTPWITIDIPGDKPNWAWDNPMAPKEMSLSYLSR